jgi:FtsP/CotA-like multicopper oxidase with cupredoxin domain
MQELRLTLVDLRRRKITVVANDGNDVEPVEVDRLIIGVSETYDVVVTIPAANTSYEFLATPEDRTKSFFIYRRWN